jgi:GT2 family glycosyltransferase
MRAGPTRVVWPTRVSSQALVQATVVIPTLDARHLLARALDSLARQTAPARVVVVDNASTDGTAEMLRERYPDVRVVRNAENLGFGRAINRALPEVEGEAIVLVNNDVVCEPDFLEEILRPLVDPRVGMVAGVLVRSREPGVIDTAGIELDPTLGAADRLAGRPVDDALQAPDPMGPCGGAAAYRASAFRDAGGFDERFFAYWEDVDLAIRLRMAGWRCALAPRARAVHHHGATLGAGSPRQRELHAFGRGYVLAKFRVAEGRPVRRLQVAALDWPALLVHLLVRREAAPLRARRRGRRAGRAHAVAARPRGLASVPVREALVRQVAFLRLRLRGALPAHYHERGPAEGGS